MTHIPRCVALGCFVAALLISLLGPAKAQIIPLHDRLEYAAASNTWPALMIKAANSSAAYVLKLQPAWEVGDHITGIELVMHRPQARDDAPNLLDPPYRWHGLQEYDFVGSDFTHGPESSIFGKVRTMHIRNRKMVLVIKVTEAIVRPIKDTTANEFTFDKLVLDVEVTNLK